MRLRKICQSSKKTEIQWIGDGNQKVVYREILLAILNIYESEELEKTDIKNRGSISTRFYILPGKLNQQSPNMDISLYSRTVSNKYEGK